MPRKMIVAETGNKLPQPGDSDSTFVAEMENEPPRPGDSDSTFVAEMENEPPRPDDSDSMLLREESDDWTKGDARKLSSTDIESGAEAKEGTTRVVTGTVQTTARRDATDQGIHWRDVLLILGVLVTGLLIMAMIIRLS
jgi:hypothetical protein